MRHVLAALAVATLPIWWAAFNLTGCRISLVELAQEWAAHYSSGLPWGVLDGER